jgi:hypothetical protein
MPTLQGEQDQTFNISKTQTTHLLLVFWANKVARESGHVAGLSRPSDQPNQRSTSGRYWSFAKSLLNLPKTVPAVQDFFIWTPKLLGKHFFNPSFCKKAHELNKNRAHGPGIFTYESLKFRKIMFAAHNFLKRSSSFATIHCLRNLIHHSLNFPVKYLHMHP